jgi:hypothetical protein
MKKLFIITYILFISIFLMGAKTERADIKGFERYDSTQTCIFLFYPPKTMKNYELVVKTKWKKYRISSHKDGVGITHKICTDKEWYKRGGMFITHTMEKYKKIFGIKFIEVKKKRKRKK